MIHEMSLLGCRGIKPLRYRGPTPQSCKPRIVKPRAISNSPSTLSGITAPTPQQLEEREELELRANTGAIYDIPRDEWLKLNKPARYLGNEFGACHKNWNDAEIRFALTYPEIYEVGASNLGHIILYGLLNQAEGLLCDRSYYPADDMKEMLERYDKKLFGVEHRRPLSEYDIMGFSLSYELGGTNILDMLQMSSIPLSWEERKEPAGVPWDPSNGSSPLIFAGGPTATSNPEPFSDFFDFFALGDGEEVLVEIGQCLRECRKQRLDRETTLYKLATTVEGVYVPQFYDSPNGWGGAVFPIKEGVPARIKRRTCAPDPFQQIGLVPYVDTVHNRLTVEIRRGCTRGCRFCQPGMLTRPARDVDPDTVVAAVEHGMKTTGYNEFSLLSLSCSDYLSLPAVGIEIKNRLKDQNVSLSLPSQRVDRFDDDIAHIVQNAGKRSGLTFAPEAGTQRMRDVINKGLTNEELLRGVKTAWDKGWKQVKLYFMIGLPGETDEDVLGIAQTVEWLQKECRQGRWHLAVNVTISNFSPKPHTPFQWHSVSTSEFTRKQQLLREAFSKFYQVKVNYTPVNISAMEDFVARGDRRVGKVIRRAWELGATNDAWWMSTDTAHAAWSQAIKDVDMEWKYRQVDVGEWDVMEYKGDERYRGQGGGGKGRVDRGVLADQRLDAPLPWDHIDVGIAKWWLKADLQKALEAATVPDCSHSNICSECGVCGDEFGHNVVFEPPPVPEFKGHYKPNSFKAQRLRFRFSKYGDMVFVGHLDLMSTLDRACRRAQLPVTTDQSPFAARQRIYVGLALPLGATGADEILEIFTTTRLDPREVKERLQAQLPAGIHLNSVEDVGVYKADGSNIETMGQLLASAEYILALSSVDDGQGAPLTHEQVSVAVSTLLSRESIKLDKKKGDKKKKGGGKKTHKVAESILEVRPALLNLEVLEDVQGEVQNMVPWKVPPGSQLVKFTTSCDFGNPVLGPSSIVTLFKQEAGCEVHLERVHRTAIGLRAPTLPKIDHIRLRSLVREEGHLAAARQWGQQTSTAS